MQPVVISDRCQQFAVSTSAADVANIGLGEFGARQLRPALQRSMRDLVSAVFRLCRPSKVSPIHASSTDAGLTVVVMSCFSAHWSRAVVLFTNEDMNLGSVSSCDPELPVSARCDAIGPQNALIRVDGGQAFKRRDSFASPSLAAERVTMPAVPVPMLLAEAQPVHRIATALDGTRTLGHCWTSLGSDPSRGRYNAARLTHCTARVSQ